jgi:hypothetical protein
VFAPEDFERIDANAALTPAQFALKHPGRPDLAELFDCYQRAPKKYPTWHGSGLVYTRLSLEQSSGEAAAQYKASLLPRGARLIDMTGGLGIDTFSFSKVFGEVVHIERDERLSAIAAHNHAVMGADNVRHITGDSMEWLRHLEPATALYIDPSRRSGGKRTIRIQDAEPDLTRVMPDLLAHSPVVLAKLSPMTDLTDIRRHLPMVAAIHVVSVGGEVKEILVVMRKDFTGEPLVHAVGLSPDGTVRFRVEGPPDEAPGRVSADKPAVLVCDPKPFQTIGAVVLLPDAAVIKAGLSGTVLRRSGAERIDAHDLCGIATMAPLPFPGRILGLRFEAPYKPTELESHLRTLGLRRAQILPKGVKHDEAQILKDLGLAHGDQIWIVVALMPAPEPVR